MAIIDNFTKEQLEEIVQNSSSLAEVIDKVGYSTHSGSNSITVKNKLNQYQIDYSNFKQNTKAHRSFENVFCQGSTASQATLRRWYHKQETIEYKCSICGLLPFWNNLELTLILDHINGINNDNRLENLRWVCPNCNQQLDTTGFKKIRTQNTIIKKFYCAQCGSEIDRTQILCEKCKLIHLED